MLCLVTYEYIMDTIPRAIHYYYSVFCFANDEILCVLVVVSFVHATHICTYSSTVRSFSS